MRTLLIGVKYFIKDKILNDIVEAQIISFNEDELSYKNLENDKEFYRELKDIEIINIINDEEAKRLNNKDVYSIQTNLIRAIVSRSEIVKYSQNRFQDLNIDENTVLISITDPDQKKLDDEILNMFKNNLSVQFWDLEQEIGRFKPITLKIAKEIKDFINNHKNDNFVIHCEAGISRSAGVGMAVYLGVEFNWDKYSFSISNNPIKEHPRYSPNYFVFDMISIIRCKNK